MEIFPDIFSSLPVLRVYLQGVGQDDEQTLALVEALNVRPRADVVYRDWLPQLAGTLVASEQTPLTPRQKVFLFACARDAYRVVLALIDHPEIRNEPVQNPVTEGHEMHANMLHCAWYLVVSNYFTDGYEIDIVHSDRVLNVLFGEVGATRDWAQDDLPLAAEHNIHALKWLIDTQPITQGTFEFVALTLLIENQNHVPWILNHWRAVNKKYTYAMVLRSAGTPYFVQVLLRFWEQNGRADVDDQGAADDDESIMENLFAFHAPATDIRVYLACSDTFTHETVTYWLERDVQDMDRTYIIMDDQRMPLPNDLLRRVLSVPSQVDRNAYVECAIYVLTHRRITQVMIDAVFPEEEEEEEEPITMLMETYSVLLRDPRYTYRAWHGVALASSGSSGALLALFRSVQVTNGYALLRAAVLEAKSPMTIRTILRYYTPTRVQMTELLYTIDRNPVGFYGVLQALQDHIDVDRAEARRFAIEAVGDDDVAAFWNAYAQSRTRALDRESDALPPTKMMKEPIHYYGV